MKNKIRKKKRKGSNVVPVLILLIIWVSLLSLFYLLRNYFPRPRVIPPVIKVPTKKIPRIAIIIDDLGYDKKVLSEITLSPVPLTLSILPGHRYSKLIARELNKNGFETLLHLPLEPKYSPNLEKRTITTKMTDEEIRKIVSQDIKDLPGISGVNTHMGSLATTDRRVMKAVLEEIKKNNLYFVDSLTTPHSVAFSLAKKMNIPTARRNVFLDNEKNLDYIKGQIETLIEKGIKDGKAIGIGHPHPLTFQAISEMAPEIKKKGIKVVPASQIVE